MKKTNDRENFLKRLFRDPAATAGIFVIFCMIMAAVAAPLLANAAPLAIYVPAEGWSFPAFRSLFFTDSPELAMEKCFNALLTALPFLVAALPLAFRFPKMKWAFFLIPLLLSGLLFTFVRGTADRTDWREKTALIRTQGGSVLECPVHYGPYETAALPYSKPAQEHPLGTDHAGRDVFARMVYGARVSTAVGFAAAALSMVIGTLSGLFAGYKGGKTDLYTMRGVEIIICFPQFLLLLILMSILLDMGSRQSIVLLIAVIGLFGWTGLCRLVRGETLKQRSMPYIAAAEGLGVPTWRILLKHLLPNVSGPIFVSFAFDAAGAILSESWLSFLGFGVQDPAASWGELMRQAFPDPLTYWHLTLWPGLAIFLAVCAFNFTGEGIRKALNPK